MPERTVGALLLESLTAQGVRHIFGIPGDAVDSFVEAIRHHPEITFVKVRHEEAGALMASATAKLTGTLAAAFATAGPGAVHLLNGAYDAALDHAPLLLLTGQVATSRIGSHYFQEIDLERLYDGVALYNRTVLSPAQAPQVIARAIHEAIRGRGVAHLVLPADVPGEKVAWQPTGRLPPTPASLPDEAALAQAAQHLAAARRIAILAGRGALSAKEELLEAVARLEAVLAYTLPAKGVLPDDHPSCLGGFGFLGTPTAHRAIGSADLLLLVGTDYPYTQFLPDDVPVVQIDEDRRALGRRVPRAIPLLGSAAPTLRALLARPELRRRQADRTWRAHLEAERRAYWEREASQGEAGRDGALHPPFVARALAELLPEDAVVTVDVGNCLVWLARHFRARHHTFLVSSWLGTMGFGLPAAIAAKLARPEKTVVAFVGDGGFTMLLGEFLTAVDLELPIVVVVLRNDKLAMIKFEQEAIGDPEWGVDLRNPDFARFAEACGGFGLKVAHPAALLPALETALSSGRTCLVEVATDAATLPRPPIVTFAEARRFVAAQVKERLGL